MCIRTGILLCTVGWYNTLQPCCAALPWWSDRVWSEGSVGKCNELLSAPQCGCDVDHELLCRPPALVCDPWKRSICFKDLWGLQMKEGVPTQTFHHYHHHLRGTVTCLEKLYLFGVHTDLRATYESSWGAALHEAWWMWTLTCVPQVACRSLQFAGWVCGKVDSSMKLGIL